MSNQAIRHQPSTRTETILTRTEKTEHGWREQPRGGAHLDLAKRDEQALLELGVEVEQPRGAPEVAAGGGERVHGGGTSSGSKDEKERSRLTREAGRPKGPAFPAAPTGTQQAHATGARSEGELKTATGKSAGCRAGGARFLRGARRKAWEWRSEARATGGINSEAGWIQAGGSGAGRRRDKIDAPGLSSGLA